MAPSQAVASLLWDERGISSLEYTMLLALISLGLMAAVMGLGQGVADRYDAGADALRYAGP